MIADPIDIKDIIENITREKRTLRPLPGDGYLFFEHDVPFLIVYNSIDEDYTTLSLVKSKSSYLIVSQSHVEFYRELCCEIAEAMSDRFGSFLILEIYTGPLGSKQFIIRGNKKKFATTLKVLQKELPKIERRRGEVQVSASVRNIKDTEDMGVLCVEDIEKCGAQFLRLEVPPVYKSEKGNIYPTYFTNFRKEFVKAIQKALFEFTRVQTSSKIESYTALGKRKLDEVVFKIDKQLHEIRAGYQFLLLIAPTNLKEARRHFFETNFEEVPDYHYRMLPVNPDLLKRRLFNLRIEDINDPAFTYIFDEKREEIDQELAMLKERGSRNFLYRSVRRYRGLDKSLVQEAKTILKEIPKEDAQKGETQITAKEFALMAEDEFSYFKKQSADFKSKIHIRDDVNILMVSRGELYLPSDTKMSKTDAKALIQHEIGTHVLTYYNGKQQPLYQLSAGLSDYDPVQEGIAMLSECLIGALSANRLRIIAGRVVAGAALLDGMDFRQMFHALYGYYGFSKENAFNITSRMFQGGGFLKDIIYLKGLVELRQYLIEGGDLDCLLAGKFAIKHIEVINELTERGILKPPAIKPRYMELPDYESKIKKIREGIPIYKLQEL